MQKTKKFKTMRNFLKEKRSGKKRKLSINSKISLINGSVIKQTKKENIEP